VVEVREIDSVLQVKDGGIAVLGGLMETRSAQGEAKLPGTEGVSIFKALFSAQSQTEEVVELVLLIKATIVTGDDTPLHNADQRLYDDYADDPRPFIK
jgi:general secretion pathway protein D